MKSKLTKLQNNADVDMTPMLDIVFILIDESNGVYFSGRLIDLEQVATNLAMFAAKYEISSVLITADENSTHNTLMNVMNNIKQYDDYPISLISK